MRKHVSARENPLFQGVQALPFDNVSEETVEALTPEQESERFLSRWLEAMRPFTAYKRYFQELDKDTSRTLREVKLYFSKLVTEGEWSEQKYVMVLDHLLINRKPLTLHSFTLAEDLYKEQRLELQKREQKAKRRRL